jgi:hypothetical protein
MAEEDLSTKKSRQMKEVESLREEKDRLLCDVQVLHGSYHQPLQNAENLCSSLDEAILVENMFLSSSLEYIQ